MGDLSKDFSCWEFKCHCGCGFDNVDIRLIKNLQAVRDKADRKVIINSGCRCKNQNLREGGAPNSMHLYGMAADIAIPGIPVRDVYMLVKDFPEFMGIGVSGIGGFVHVDVRRVQARALWTYINGRPAPWVEPEIEA